MQQSSKYFTKKQKYQPHGEFCLLCTSTILLSVIMKQTVLSCAKLTGCPREGHTQIYTSTHTQLQKYTHMLCRLCKKTIFSKFCDAGKKQPRNPKLEAQKMFNFNLLQFHPPESNEVDPDGNPLEIRRGCSTFARFTSAGNHISIAGCRTLELN